MISSNRPQPPMLSICIPTYNRCELLRDTLFRLEEGLREGECLNDIEIVIGNNCSADGTAPLLDTWESERQFPNFKAVNRPENIGAERNFLALLREASGDYCWLVSDDDKVVIASLAKLLRLLRENQPSFVVINIEEWGGDSKLLKFEDSPCIDLNDLCVKTGSWLTFLSLMVVRREKMAPHEYPNYLGTYMVHSYMFLDVASKGDGLFFTSNPLIRFRAGQSGGYSILHVFVTRYLELLSYARTKGLSKIAYLQVGRTHLYGFVLSLIVKTRCFGSTGRFSVNLADASKELVATVRRYPAFVVPLGGVWLVALVPERILRAGYGGFKMLTAGAKKVKWG